MSIIYTIQIWWMSFSLIWHQLITVSNISSCKHTNSGFVCAVKFQGWQYLHCYQCLWSVLSLLLGKAVQVTIQSCVSSITTGNTLYFPPLCFVLSYFYTWILKLIANIVYWFFFSTTGWLWETSCCLFCLVTSSKVRNYFEV